MTDQRYAHERDQERLPTVDGGGEHGDFSITRRFSFVPEYFCNPVVEGVRMPRLASLRDWPYVSPQFFEKRGLELSRVKLLDIPDPRIIEDTDLAGGLIVEALNTLDTTDGKSAALLIEVAESHEGLLPDREKYALAVEEAAAKFSGRIEVQTADPQKYYSAEFTPVTNGGTEYGSDFRSAYVDLYGERVPDNGPCLLIDPTEEQIEDLWNRYQDKMTNHDSDTPSVDSLDRDEFERILKNPRTYVFAYLAEGSIDAACVFSTDLDDYWWVDKAYYRRRFPKHFTQQSVLEFPFIFNAGVRAGGKARELIQLMSSIAAHMKLEALITFDCNPQNQRRVPLMVKSSIESTLVDGEVVASVDIKEEATQHFFLLIRQPD